MLNQNQARPKNFISHISPTTNTLFNNTGTHKNNSNYLLGNFNLNPPPQQFSSPTFTTKMNVPSTQSFSSCAGDQKLPPSLMPSMMGQGNNMLFDDLYQKSQGFNEGLFIEPLSTSCINTVEPSTPSSQPSPTSIFNHSMIDPLYKPRNSDISVGKLF